MGYTFIKKSRTLIQFGLMESYSEKTYAGNKRIENFFITPILDMRFILVPKRLTFKLLGWYQHDFEEKTLEVYH